MLQTSEPYIRTRRYSELNNLLEISIGSLRKLRCWRVLRTYAVLWKKASLMTKLLKWLKRIYTLSISHDQSWRIGHHRRSHGMCRGGPRTNKYHTEKIKRSQEEGKFWRVYVLWWLTRRVKGSSNAHPTLMDCEFRSNAWDDVTQIEVLFLVSFFCGRELRAVISGKQIS